jgi:hypothetical protein
MALLTSEQMDQAKDLIFRQGRLLERQLYRYFFEDGDRTSCLKALLGYQNADGGFGNGLEPDLLCPDSTAIGAESALFVLDLLDYHESDVLEPLLDWLATHQTETGEIPHPPANLAQYPYQPWWEGDDSERVFTIAGMLKSWQQEHPEFFAGVRRLYEQTPLPDHNGVYTYPVFVYLKHCQQTPADTDTYKTLLQRLPSILNENADHFPLFSRSWYHFQDEVDASTLEQAAEAVAAALRNEEGTSMPYPELPWWKPIFTLDSLILLKKRSYL